MSLVTVDELDSGAILKLYNSRSLTSKEPVDARQLNQNFNAYLSTINTLIQQVKLLEANTVTLDGDQLITGTKTFTDIEIIGGLGDGVLSTFFTLNSGSNTDVDQSLRFNRNATSGLVAALFYDQSDSKLKAFIDLNLGTKARLAVADPIDGEDAVNLTYATATFCTLLTAQIIAGQKTFSAKVYLNGGAEVTAPTIGADVVNLTYATSNFCTLATMQTITGQKTFSAAVALNGGGQVTDPLVGADIANKQWVLATISGSGIPQVQDISISGGILNTNVLLGQSAECDNVNTSFTLANPTNATDGDKRVWVLKVDATGGYTLTLGSKFKLHDTLTLPVTLAANKIYELGARYDNDEDKWRIVAFISYT